MTLEQKIRAALLKSLGHSAYLSLVSSAYLKLIRAGFMKAKYPELFYLKTLIKPGFICIDIGANVGYYATFLSDYAGEFGKVYAIEPVPLFAGVLKKNLGNFRLRNTEIMPYALGAEEKIITLGTPVIEGVFRHGLTKVVDKQEAANLQTFEAEMKVPDQLFASLSRLDFIKCDVEGYETLLFPQMMQTLSRFKPTVQIEINTAENRRFIIDLLKPLGYQPHGLENGKLTPLKASLETSWEKGDYYFIAE